MKPAGGLTHIPQLLPTVRRSIRFSRSEHSRLPDIGLIGAELRQ